MGFKIVCTSSIDIHVDKTGLRNLPDAEFVDAPCSTEDEIIAVAHDADAIVALLEPYTEKVIQSLSSCRLICTPKTGYDNINIAAATEKGICVSCVPAVSSEEISDHAFALLLACARKLYREDKAVRSGQWRSIHGPEMQAIWRGIMPLRGQTLGLIGFGRAARPMVPKAKGFSLRVIVYDPYIPDSIVLETGAEPVELERLLRESDFISIHSALTKDNRHMLGYEQFRLMKPAAYIINTARGPLIDERALLEALNHGMIAGAGLDVLEVEPARMDNPLLMLDNVIVTGHSAHYSDPSTEAIRRRALEDVALVMKGELPLGLVNASVKECYVARWKTTSSR